MPTTIVKSISANAGSAAGVQVPTAPPPQENNGGDRSSSSFKRLKEKRGVRPGTKRGPYDKGNRPGVPAGEPVQGIPAPAGTPLFTPENAKIIVRMPFNMAFARTGWDGWVLSPVEAETLAAPMAVTLNTFGVTWDPKWVSVSLLAVALLSIVGEKTLMYRAACEERDRLSKLQPAPSNPGATPTPEDTPK